MSGGTISWAEGSFPNATITGESDDGTANDFSLQLNTQTNLTNSAITALCKLTATPSSCTGWVQFVYWRGAAEIWYNLIGSGGTCPSSAWSKDTAGNCYYEAPNASTIPGQAISNLPNMTLTGTAGGATDTVTVTTGPGQMYAATNTSIFDLSPEWTYADFNVLGNNTLDIATFKPGTTLGVQLLTDSPTGNTSAPTCGPYNSTTGESNNLTFVSGSCCPFGGEMPGIQFTESNVAGATAPACPTVTTGWQKYPVPGCVTALASAGPGRNYAIGCTAGDSKGDYGIFASYARGPWTQMPGNASQIAGATATNTFVSVVSAQGAGGLPYHDFFGTSDNGFTEYPNPGCATTIAEWNTDQAFTSGASGEWITGCSYGTTACALRYLLPLQQHRGGRRQRLDRDPERAGHEGGDRRGRSLPVGDQQPGAHLQVELERVRRIHGGRRSSRK